ncbi:MAG: Phosphate starvation-inducible protein PhoH, putative ATPase [Myxococcaceae bacterium]|nr:Phosphate starvation-inducible protein PhoH, putative ATPase [Myxococcaceae bacterium]
MPIVESEATRTPVRISTEIEVPDSGLLIALTGPNGANLKPLERAFDVGAGLRGNTIRLVGTASSVALAERAISELLELVRRGSHLGTREVERSIETLRKHPDVKLAEMLDDVVQVGTGKRGVTPKGVAQQQYIQAMREHDIVFGVGPAGTGKTYLAMAAAVSALLSRKYKRIILTRPAVEAGEKLGFLPGDLADKVNPYLRPLYDALNDMMDAERAQDLLTRGTIEVAPLAFMRGRTLNNSFVILDEAQNTTIDQMKMFLTRLGYDSKAIITGDVTQIDLPDGRKSGLRDAISLLDGVDGIGMCRFSDADVVRHPLVQRIVRAYDARDEVRRVAEEEQRATYAEEARARRIAREANGTHAPDVSRSRDDQEG